LGNIGGDFLKDNLPPGFSDPTSWGAVKAGSGILKFIGGLVGKKDPVAAALLNAGGSALGGDGSGTATSLASLIPQPFGAVSIGSPGDAPGASGLVPDPGSVPGLGLNPADLVSSGIGTGPAPGPGGNTTNIDNSATYHALGSTDAAKQVVNEGYKRQHMAVRRDLHPARLAPN
jgi:hypothetical protein